MDTIRIELPYPPSINHYYRIWCGRMLISRKGRTYRRTVQGVLATTRGVRECNGPLSMVIEVYSPDKRRGDIDNLQKPLLDALEHGGVYTDDSQIKTLTTRWLGVEPGGRVVVHIRETTA